jgi:copper chaperone CopZ
MLSLAKFIAPATLLMLGLVPPQELATVKIKDVHLCCGQCVNAINKAVAGIDGLKAACDRDNGTVTFEAKDLATAQKGVDAIAGAGYHGTVEADNPKFPETKDIPEGKVKSLKLDGVHNCCGGCTMAVSEAVKSVEGVAANTLKARQKAFEVTGDFEAAAVIKALNAAGFHVTVAK